MRVRVQTCLPAIAAVIVGGALLTACNDDSDSSDASSSPSQTTSAAAPSDTSAAPTTSATASSTGGAGNSGSPVAVNKSFDDPVLGEKATVLKYVAGYQPSAAAKSKFSALADEDVVLVDVKVTASSKYYDTFGADSFYLTGMSNGIDQASTTILDDELKSAGYTPLPDAETGKTTTGWVAFTPDKGDAKKLVLRYKRLAAQANDGMSISAKNFDIPLN
ncbi:hypothetical protein SAMN05216223_104256 [Actinacidiphila yanglinensis]|uniref:Lipoprotein n=1 Tax=Actinacidiphila yanglinensis TaxID=310779 RepID=A0A1H5Z0J1_9ACTN|nr:hypothetical protein [Actinacidiphila yanglinensis]SEG30109.1 hypothetical protein SAMN05216223_104256 [Actinacidiphila yanglinensis]